MKGYLMWSEWGSQRLAVDLFSNTRRNPANAQYKRRKLYFNILPRINGPQTYQRRVPIDDWDTRVHRRISRAAQRGMTGKQGWAWFDNSLDRGYILYLTSVPGLKEFEPVEDVEPVLIDALRAIHPPGREEGEGRFRPYGGSQNWVGKTDYDGEDDAGRWEVIAVAHGPTDFVAVEAECVVSGVATEFRPPYWRAQPYQGLTMRFPDKQALVSLALDFPEQYTLTRAALIEEGLGCDLEGPTASGNGAAASKRGRTDRLGQQMAS
jgi:hypothetical protein